MKDLAPFIVSGIFDGSIYALAAIGLVLTFRISGIFNFAHGTLAAASAYTFYRLRVSDHMPWPVAAAITVMAVGLLGGLVLERIAYWLADAPAVLRVVATVGLLAAISSFLTGYFGPRALIMPPFLPRSELVVDDVHIGADAMISFAVALAATVGLYLFFKRTRMGAAMQAVVDDAPLVALQGISPDLVRRVAWAIGSSFVSISGILLAPKIGADVNILTLLVITAFGVAAVGAFSNLALTFAGGIAVGIVMNVLSYKTSNVSSYALQQLYLNVPFIVLVVALVAIPRRHLIERGVQRVRRATPAPSLQMGVNVAGIGAATLAALLIPAFVGPKINQYSAAGAYVIIFASIALLVWTSGEVSLAQMSFAAIGAATYGHALQHHFPWLISLALSGLVLVPIAALVAVPARRLSGLYVAVLTFGFGLLVQQMFFRSPLMFGNQNFLAVDRPKPFNGLVDTNGDKTYYYVVVVVAALSLVAATAVRRVRLGRLLRAFGDSPLALTAHGINTTTMGVSAFCVSAFLAGIGGALLAGVTSSASGVSFDFTISLSMIAVLVASTALTLGRRMPITASIIASVVFVVLKVYISDSFYVRYQGVIFGSVALAVACAPGILAAHGGLQRGWMARLSDPGPLARGNSSSHPVEVAR
jgi:branched-subunit amino acid ABC-type transport system permease component